MAARARAQVLMVRICDSAMTGRPDVGYVKLPLVRMPSDGLMTAWLPVQARPPLPCLGELLRTQQMGRGTCPAAQDHQLGWDAEHDLAPLA